MKEVMAIVRQNKVNQTKETLAEAGFPAFTCRKVLGRGKKALDLSILSNVLESGDMPVSPLGENFTESLRLISKRVFTLMVKDEDVEKVITAIVDTNSTGNPGDGKIFVLPVLSTYRVRNGESDVDAY